MLLYIAAGGAIGASLRYLSSQGLTRLLGHGFPYGTFAVNIIGSFLMGIAIGYLNKTLPHSNELRAFISIGVLGGFTTFSSFSLDVITLLEEKSYALAGLYIGGSVVGAVLAIILGLFCMRGLS